jgi:hypothetical protein
LCGGEKPRAINFVTKKITEPTRHYAIIMDPKVRQVYFSSTVTIDYLSKAHHKEDQK